MCDIKFLETDRKLADWHLWVILSKVAHGSLFLPPWCPAILFVDEVRVPFLSLPTGASGIPPSSPPLFLPSLSSCPPSLSRKESTLVLKVMLVSAINFAQYMMTFVVLPWSTFTAHGGIGRQPALRSVFVLLSLRQPLLYFAVLVVMESMVYIAAGRVAIIRIKVSFVWYYNVFLVTCKEEVCCKMCVPLRNSIGFAGYLVVEAVEQGCVVFVDFGVWRESSTSAVYG